MATKKFYATGDFRYGTRMLRAGEPVELDAPSARLFQALGKISQTKPREARPPAPTPAPEPVGPATAAPAAPKPAAPRKRRVRGRK